MDRKVKGFIVTIAALIVALAATALAGSSTVTILSVVDNGDDTYAVDVASTTGMTAGDHFGAPLAAGGTGVFAVESITDSNTVVLADTLTEEHGDVFGVPTTGAGWYATPAGGLSRVPFRARHWDAAGRRNTHLLRTAPRALYTINSQSDQASGSLSFTVPAGTLASDGDALRITVVGQFNHTATGTFRVIYNDGTDTNTLGATGALSATRDVSMDIAVFRLSASTGSNVGVVQNETGTSGTLEGRMSVGDSAFNVDWTGDVDISVTTTTAGAANTLDVGYMLIEYVPAP